ncbi:MAG TPA: aldo/keto reductase [Tepidisphaeraceae bacterium]|nr:aldo/keto reductase [Tepidisphaeraceae bacterium]
MQMRQLGTSDVGVSPIIFGAWAIGGWMWGGQEESDSIAAIRASIDAGVTTIDTAAIYGMGYSEQLVAKAIKGRRDRLQIATKCGMRWDAPASGDQGSDPWPTKDNAGRDVIVRKNARPESILYECEQSLRRLQIDVIDLYQIHWPDASTPVEESMRAMVKLKEQGKIRAIGVSNYDVEWMRKAEKVTKIASNQPPFSLMQRKIEKQILPYCREHNIGVIVYSPLERGLLAGAVPPEREFPEGDHRRSHQFFTPEMRRKVLASLEKIRPIKDRHDASFAQLAINWTVHEPGITAALVGARNAEQATHNAAALSFTLTDDERRQIRAAFDEIAITS